MLERAARGRRSGFRISRSAKEYMSGQAFLDRLKGRFGERIAGANLTATDPWVQVTPDGIAEVAAYLRDEPDLRFDMLNCISGVDYFEPDAKKAAKNDWQPHMEVVYHLSSVKHKTSLVLKVHLAAVEE